MNGVDRKQVLETLLAAFDRGEEPDPARLLANNPGHEDTIRALIQAARTLAAQPPVPELAPGDTLGDFEIERKLAEGGMGTVYVARQRSLGGRPVALKVARATDQRPAHRERARREAILLAPLHHPHLSEVYGFGEERGLLFIAMQLVEGRDLRELGPELPRGSDATVRRIVTWAAEIAEGLAALHAHGLIHRDVKPANIVIGGQSGDGGQSSDSDRSEGSAVLVDFGLVRELHGGGGATTTGNLATPRYAAPEQLLGLDVGPAADTFALGVTLYDLLGEQDPGERAHASAGLDPLEPERPGLDRDLVALIAKATDPDPRWRYADGAALYADLAAWLAGTSVSARHPPALERAQRWIGTHPQKLLRTFVLAVGLVLAASGLVAAGRYSGAADRAQTALERGELIAFQDAVREVPRALRPLLLRGSDLARAVHDVEVNPERHGLAAVVERMRAGDAGGALLAAVTSLEMHGYAADPTLRRFVENALVARDSDGRMSPLARRALGLLARLFYERPVVDPHELAATATVRARLLELWSRASLRHHERLLVLTSFAGCGAGADASWILAWATGDRDDPEDMRISLHAAEHILRRAHRCGELDGLDIGALERQVLPLVHEALGGPKVYGFEIDHPQGVALAGRQVAVALCYARRALGGDSQFLDILPSDWRERWSAGMELMLPLANPELGEWLGSREAAEIEHLSMVDVGGICATQSDPDLTRRMRALCERESASRTGRARWLSDFDRGFALGSARMRGVFEAALPDADTLLIVRDEPELARPVEVVRGSTEEDAGALGVWDFASDPVRVAGIASGANERFAGPALDELLLPYLRFGRFGKSEVELVFEVTEPVPALHVIELRHLAASRPYYPYGGEAYLDVELDDKPIERLLVLGAQPHAGKVELSADLLSPGRHVLRIRSHPDTTTTYRLKRAVLRVAR